jgi:undecaprenyl-diphosphatase
MTILDAGVLGIVEGLTEFLPVSSTGHLILTGQLLGLPSDAFVKSFDIAIQLGAILAVVVLYWRSFLSLPLLKRVIVAFIPTAIIGLALYKVVKTYLLGSDAVVLAALFLGGIILILVEKLHTPREDAVSDVTSLSYKQSLLIGVAQAVAVIPGVSRSGATVVGGLLMNISRATIVEFSFLLAVPTMAAATGLDLVKSYSDFSSADIAPLLIGFIVSFIVALFAVKYFLAYVRKHSFIPFAIYRIAVSVLFFVMFFVF